MYNVTIGNCVEAGTRKESAYQNALKWHPIKSERIVFRIRKTHAREESLPPAHRYVRCYVCCTGTSSRAYRGVHSVRHIGKGKLQTMKR